MNDVVACGPRPRPSVGPLVPQSLSEDPVIAYPDRKAKLLRNTFEKGVGQYLADRFNERRRGNVMKAC